MDDLDRARKALSNFCKGKQTICIPAQNTDDDIVIALLFDKYEYLESQLAEARKLVKGLVECVDWYGSERMNWSITIKSERHEYTTIDETDIEKIETTVDDGAGVFFGGKRARQYLKDNAEAIERLTKEEK